jgi:hypothetical protein
MAVMAGNAEFQGNARKDQLFASDRLDCMSDARIVERLTEDRSMTSIPGNASTNYLFPPFATA